MNNALATAIAIRRVPVGEGNWEASESGTRWA
jgi:hypothetical protein